MKTTIDIADGLLEEARARARAEGTTLRALVEDGLRKVLDEEAEPRKPFRLLVWGDPNETLDQEAVEEALREARRGRQFPELEEEGLL